MKNFQPMLATSSFQRSKDPDNYEQINTQKRIAQRTMQRAMLAMDIPLRHRIQNREMDAELINGGGGRCNREMKCMKLIWAGHVARLTKTAILQ